MMKWLRTARILAVAALACAIPGKLAAAGDLLVAPTRVILESGRGTEVILNNIGAEPATYRISLEVKRMQADGSLVDVAAGNANSAEQAALSMIAFAPKRVVLPPNQPQSVRISARAPAGLADGEYRVHMLFRAIPESKPVTATPATKGVSIALIPIYGVTIPIIVRQGNLSATAALANPRLDQSKDGPALLFDISRTGSRSVYGRIRVLKAGVAQPVLEARGIAVYGEIARRTVRLPIDPATASQLRGPVTIQYLEDSDVLTGTIAEIKAVIR